MKYTEFLDALELVKRQWYLTRDGQICSSVHVTDDVFVENGLLQVVAQRRHGDDRSCGFILKLESHLVRQIADAANNAPSHDLGIRSDLLRVCGLKEQVQA